MTDGVRVTLASTAPIDAGTAVVVAPGEAGGTIRVDGAATPATLDQRDPVRARLTIGEGADTTTALVLPPTARGAIEVVVDGWRIEVRLESAARAELQDRASRSRGGPARRGPAELRAIIPGRVVSVAVAVGDAVTSGQQVLILEAMKMQNELRAPRDGTVARVAAAPGQTIEVGDLLLVIE